MTQPPPLPTSPIPPSPLAPPANKKTGCLKITCIIIGCILLSLAALGVFGFFYVKSARDIAITSDQKSALFTYSDIVQLYEEPIDVADYETFTHQRYYDGSTELAYELDHPADEAPYILCTIHKEISKSDAKYVALGAKSTSRLMFNGFGLSEEAKFTFTPHNDWSPWADSAHINVVHLDGQPVGNNVVLLSGKWVYDLTLSGMVIETKEEFDSILLPKLQALNLTKTANSSH